MRLPLPLLAALVSAAAAADEAVTLAGRATLVTTSSPVGKVVGLLRRLEGAVTERSASEAAQYDRYACFCKSQARQKEAAILRSNDRIAVLDANIAVHDAKIGELNSEISRLGTKISDLAGAVQSDEEARRGERETYLVTAANYSSGIAALEAAIHALRESKTQMTDAKLNLAQLRAFLADRATGVFNGSSISTRDASLRFGNAIAMYGRGSPTDPEHHSYNYSSNDIIATLQTLLVDFKREKQVLDESEFQKQSAFDKKILGLQNERDFASKQKAQQEKIVGARTEEREAQQADRDSEQAARDADKGFSDKLTEECQQKAVDWDKRAVTYAQELSAINEAIQILEKHTLPLWKAKAKLAGLERGAESSAKYSVVSPHVAATAGVKKGRVALGHKVATPAVFLQVQKANDAPIGSSLWHALRNHLDRAAAALHSTVLSSLAVQVHLGGDHFVRVRSIIKDLIARLEADALSEQTTKSYCDGEMQTVIGNRDSSIAEVEEQSSIIATKKAEKAAFLREVAELSQEIAELHKGLQERTELRRLEKAENEQTISEADAGQQSVEDAIDTLRQFYEGQFLLTQAAVRALPAGADREGNTVGMIAPEVFKSGHEYKGNQESWVGVVKLLEVVAADFQRTKTELTKQETQAENAHSTFLSETNGIISAKQLAKSNKETAIATAESDGMQAMDSRFDAERLHEAALRGLDSLRAMCVEGETWEDRKEKRLREIEALKQALSFLNEWRD